MNTNIFCPISNKKTDENVARLTAFFTVGLLIVFVVTQNVVPAIFLLADFILRGAGLALYSPLAFLSRSLLKILKFEKKTINAGPKIFAARIGVVFSAGIMLFSSIGFLDVALGITVVFGICAFLEAVFGFCVACQVYPFVYKLTNREVSQS
ncbi:MAG: DUF4395 domain-containing protein [Paludibacter sp.]|nr:DUF4395 domain-containing protein [Paludibacter sp.]